MPRKISTGIRKPMSPEARAKIAEAVKSSARKKRIEAGLPADQPLPQGPIRQKIIDIVQMRNQTFDKSLFIPMATGREIDFMFSLDGGINKATNYLVIGDPGVGKSTVTLDIVSDLVSLGYQCLFISAEMTRIDLFKYVERFPKFGHVDTLFLGEYCDDNPKLVIEEALAKGYDLVLIDSFVEVQDSVKEATRVTSNSAEKWLIDQMLKNNMGENDPGKNTAFLCIQQVTKGGVFLGSNKLKHITTGMLEMRYEDGNAGATFLHFTKNRRGPCNIKMYFELRSGGQVIYTDPTGQSLDPKNPIEQLASLANPFEK
jgi:predicted ATP-dependent serine protease